MTAFIWWQWDISVRTRIPSTPSMGVILDWLDSCLWTCRPNSQLFSATDLAFPKFSKLLRPLFQHGIGPHRMAKVLRVMHLEKYDELQLQYYANLDAAIKKPSLQMVLLARVLIVSFFESTPTNSKRFLGSYHRLSLPWCCSNRFVSAITSRLCPRDTVDSVLLLRAWPQFLFSLQNLIFVTKLYFCYWFPSFVTKPYFRYRSSSFVTKPNLLYYHLFVILLSLLALNPKTINTCNILFK